MAVLAPWIIPIGLLVFFEALADILAKEWQLKQSHWLAVGSLACYLVANSFWLFALRNGSGLARGGLVFSVACMLLALFIGVWMYGEQVTKLQCTGIGLGFVAVVLMSWEG